MKNFKKLKVWQKGFEIAVKSFDLIHSFPKEEKFGISSQITKSAVSIPSNIAEGSRRIIADSLKYRWVQPLNWKRNY